MKKIKKYSLGVLIALLAVVLASTLTMTVLAEECPACSKRSLPAQSEMAKATTIVPLAVNSQIKDFNVTGGLKQYEREFKDIVFRRGEDNPRFEVMTGTPGYCPSYGGSHLYESISSVTYTKKPGNTAIITVNIYIANPTGCTYGEPCPEYDESPEYINAWIDWDGDGIFEDNEKVMDSALTGYINLNYHGTMTASNILTLPPSAVSSTWMRVNLGWGHDPNNPCESSWTWGNVVDKEISIYKGEIVEKVVKVDIYRKGNKITTLEEVKTSNKKIYEFVWDWKSDAWNKIPDEIPVGEYKAKAKITTKDGTELASSKEKEFYVIFDYNLGEGFVESKNAFSVDFDTGGILNIIDYGKGIFPLDQYDSQKFKTALSLVDGQTQVRQASTSIGNYAENQPHPDPKGKKCNCKHHAWAMIEYTRAVGIPARFLTGIGEWNDGEGIAAYKFKPKFGHAFVEINDKKDGWIHYDPTGWGDDNQFGSDEYAKVGAEFRPDISGSGYWVSASPKISNTGIIGTENIYDRYTFCSDATSITFLNPPYDYGQTMQFSVTVKNNGAIPVNTPVHVRLFDVPTILSLGPSHEIEDVIIANSLNPGESVTKQFSWTLPDFGVLNSFYEVIGDRDVKAVVYYKASRAGNVEIETDVLSARVPGLCISPIQTITVDGEERSLTNATFTHLNQTAEKSWRKETYILDIPSIVDIYTETEAGENYSKAIVSIENPYSVKHHYSFLAQLAGWGDAIFVPPLGSVTTNLSGVNVSTDCFVTYLQANGTNGYVSIYKFSKNTTIESIEILEYEGISGVFVNVTWNQTLTQESLQDFLIYTSIINGNNLSFSEICRAFAEEIVENEDSLVNVGIATPTQCRVGDIHPINITLFNNGVKNETITTTLNITKIINNIPHTTLSLYNDTTTATVPSQTEEIVTFMVPISEYTKSGLWNIDVTTDKVVRAKTTFMIEDAFDLNCTQNITVEQHSGFIFNVKIANTWDIPVHNVNATIELVDYFNTSDPRELSIGNLLPNENITITWQLNATSSGLLPIEVRVTSDDGGYDTVGTTVTSLSQPSLWIPNVIETISPNIDTNKTVSINIIIYNIGDLTATNVSAMIVLPEDVKASNITWSVGYLVGGENATLYTNITFTKPEDFVIDVFAFDDVGHNASSVIYVDVISTDLSASFNNVYSDFCLDTNGDGRYDYLVIEVGVNVTTEGIANVEGWLYDSNGSKIVKAENSSYLSLGNCSLLLKFSGFDIYKHGVDGEYDLKDLKLYNESRMLIDNRSHAYITSAYNYTDFQYLVVLTGNYSDYGTDTDGNGLFDNLTVNVEVILASEGHIVATARLVDKNGEEIVWASNTSWLEASETRLIQLNFDGRSIGKHSVDGPYYLKDVYVYHTGDPAQSDYVCDAYTTNFYNYTDFEGAITLPDLTLTSADISFSPTTQLTEGDSVRINATVHNNGGAAASDFMVSFFDGAIPIGIDTISITANSVSTASITWTAVVGDRTIKVVADSEDAINESDETNNEATKTITVKEKAVVVSPVPSYRPRRGGGGGGGGSRDTDGDGVSDVDEILAGTDWKDANDYPGKAEEEPVVTPTLTATPTPRPVVTTPTPSPTAVATPTTTPPPTPQEKIPGFEVFLALFGLLAVAYLLRRKKAKLPSPRQL